MSQIFTTRFDNGFDDFTVSGAVSDLISFPLQLPVPGYGCGDGYALICQSNTIHRRLKPTYDLICNNELTTEMWPTLVPKSTTNIYFAAHAYSASSWNNSSTVTDVKIAEFNDVWRVADPIGVIPTAYSFCTAAFTGYLYLQPDGKLKFKINTNSFFTEPDFEFTSSAGAFPVDGLQHCISVQLDFPAGGISLDGNIYVDGVSVLTFSHTKTDTGVPWGWGGGCAYHCDDPSVETRGGITEVVILTHYGLGLAQSNFAWAGLDIYDSLEGGATCSCAQNSTPITFNTCSVPSLADDYSYDCALNQLTITGTGFPLDPTVEIQDQYGEQVAFTIISRTAFEIVVQITDNLITGQHCMSVT